MKNYRILLGCLFALGQATAQAAQYAYVANLNYGDMTADALIVLDTATNTIATTIPLGQWPSDMAINPALGVVYVDINTGAPPIPGNIVVINGLTNQIIGDIPGTGPNPRNAVVNSAGTRLYVQSENSTISVIDTATDTVVATIPGSGYNGLALNPAGTRLYDLNTVYGNCCGPGLVRVIDTASNTVIGSPITVGVMPQSVAVDPTGTRAYVVNSADGTITVIDTATSTVVSTIQVSVDNDSAFPEQILFNATGTRAYIKTGGVLTGHGQLAVMDPATQAFVARIQLPSTTNGAAIDPEGTFVYVAIISPGVGIVPSVDIIDTATYAITTILTPPNPAVGTATQSVAVLPSPSNSVYCPGGNMLTKPNSIYLANTGQQMVTDNTTGLMWKQCSEGQSGTGCTGTATTMTWGQALSDAATSNFAGYGDWRLPNEKELESLYETACYDPSINRNIFPATQPHPYWSSTTYTYWTSKAWYVDFSGAINANFPDFSSLSYYVRLVRSGQPLDSFDKEASFTPNGFSFAAQPSVPLNSPIISNTITLTGLTTSTGISIAGGNNAQYSIGGEPYTASPGAVVNGNTVNVRQTSANLVDTTTSVTLTVGGVAANFSVTTFLDPVFSNGFE
jgi:YVTN family beta-propeller protein